MLNDLLDSKAKYKKSPLQEIATGFFSLAFPVRKSGWKRVMTLPLPTPQMQVGFLRNIQRLLAEGQFVASYKLALVHALADLAVVKGDDFGSELQIGTKEIAVKFIELYWRQCRYLQIGNQTSRLILQQNTGERQAAILSKIAACQQEGRGSVLRFQMASPERWRALVSEVEQVVRAMPLWKLQTLGNERLEFLYENLDRGGSITLKPGVAYCFRAFYELIRDLIEGAWIRFIQKVNAHRLGNTVDLGAFLFSHERTSLEVYRPILTDLQRGECQYCQKPLSGKTQVDHFVPWSRYPCDLGQNMVLAHERCNRAKSDFLAAEQHLAAWIERNRSHRSQLHERLIMASLPCDGTANDQIAKWAYRKTEEASGQVWVEKKILRHLGPGWVRCFAA